MSAYMEPMSLISSVVCYGICTVAWCAKLHKEISKTKLTLPFIIGFADSIAGTNDFVADNHNVFPVIIWQKFLLMSEVVSKFFV